MMTDDTSILTAWYIFAASTPGFLGDALHLHRQHSSLSLTQQRHLLTSSPDVIIHTSQLAALLRTTTWDA